ncbi:MAG: FAD-binding protein [Coxiellaceae bacterium]|nr:FAD-binding protein [Coxiellaceae bacterium]
MRSSSKPIVPVVVVGAGGLVAAMALAKKGLPVVLIEKREHYTLSHKIVEPGSDLQD